jgi:uncharacterized protein (DUF433 family)
MTDPIAWFQVPEIAQSAISGAWMPDSICQHRLSRPWQNESVIEDLLARIVVDPQVCFGKPTIKGHRIWVSLVLGYLAEGWSVADVVAEFEGIDADDVLACVAYGARLADVRFIDLDDVA